MKEPEFIEVGVSFRRAGGHLECSFVASTGVLPGGQQTILDSRHIAGRDELLVDQALQEVRRQVLEHVLTLVEPF